MKRLGAIKKASLDSNGWKHYGIWTLNINQAALSNWAPGGEEFMFGINTIFNESVHHRNGPYTLDAYFDLELGVVEAASFKTFRKTNDRLDITIEFEHDLAGKHWNYGILTKLFTQLFPGHDYSNITHPTISNFFTPGKALLCPGVDYKAVNEKQYFSFFVSPATVRWITKLDNRFYDVKKFGVDSSTKVYTEVGAYVSFHYNRKLSKTVQYLGRLDFFSNYKRNPENIDMLMNNLLTFSISKLFAGSLLVDLIYDHDTKARLQVQELIGLGLRLNL